MKKILLVISGLSAMLLLMYSCSRDVDLFSSQEAPVSTIVLDNIIRLGFSNDGVKKVEGGYLVEGDLFMDEVFLQSQPEEIRVPTEEQYHTTNLVLNTPRTINVFVEKKMKPGYDQAAAVAVARFNAEPLDLTFVIVDKKQDAHITIETAPKGAPYLAIAGFPSAAGDPFQTIRVNVEHFGTNPNLPYLGTVIAHELGHCIGFRHTDYYNSGISGCNPAINEGAGISGAVHIPGTPDNTDLDADPGSWMLSCISAGADRPFTNDDKLALNYLY